MEHATLAYHFKRDVGGKQYGAVLELLLGQAKLFGLVWRRELEFHPSASRINDDLADLRERERITSHWPGTLLLEHKAVLRLYRCDPVALEVLRRPGSIFSWLSPEFPEDLCFFGADLEPVFASVSHEKDAWIISSSIASLAGQMVKLSKMTLEGENASLIRGVA